jgi:hypothetical protein
VTLRALGRLEEAWSHWLEALAIFERLGPSDAEQVRVLLSDQPLVIPGTLTLQALGRDQPG